MEVQNLFNALKQGNLIVFTEPCNCEELYGNIRHNNGGNYHKRISFRSLGNRIRVKFSTTADYGLLPDEPPIIVEKKEAEKMIKELIQKEWLIEIY